MIINIRGSHGSGKSTVVRRVMAHFPFYHIDYKEGRKRPFGYLCSQNQEATQGRLYIMGSYETPTGGCDTIPDTADIYNQITKVDAAGTDILFEGILAQHNTTKMLDIPKDRITFIVLNTSLSDCIASVKQRRAERGDERPFNPANVEREYKSTMSSMRRIRDAGRTLYLLDREAAYLKVLEILGLEHHIAAGRAESTSA